MFLRILRMTRYMLRYKWRLAFLHTAGFAYGIVDGGIAAMAGLFVRLLDSSVPNEGAAAALLGRYADWPVISALLRDYGAWFNNKERLFYCGVAAFALLMVALAVLVYFQAYIGEWMSVRVGIDTRQDLVEKLLKLDFAYFKRVGIGEIWTRVGNDLDRVNQAAFELTVVLTRPFTIAVCLGYVFYINWRLALWALVGVPVTIVALRKLYKKMRSAALLAQQMNVNVNDAMMQFISGIGTVKAFACEDFEIKNFVRHNANLFRYTTKRSRARCAERPVTSLCSKAGILIVVIISGQMVLRGELAGAELMTFLVALQFIAGPSKELSKSNAVLQTCIPSAARVFEILDAKVEVPDGTRELGSFSQGIRFSHVSFAYEPGKPVIKDFNLEIPAGKRVALVGASGSGKTTLLSLLMRLYDVDEGEITIDGVNVKELTFKSLRSQMALVSQNPFLFNCSVRENITYGRPDVSDAEVERAAKAANIHAEIMQMPQGYATPVGDLGDRLSGGQKQRLCIARAICKNASVLLLDEATSALDSENEHQVHLALDNLMRNRTSITIAHRLSTITNSDEIIMMRAGQIIGRGPHLQLLASCPEYAHLVRMQEISEETPAPASPEAGTAGAGGQ